MSMIGQLLVKRQNRLDLALRDELYAQKQLLQEQIADWRKKCLEITGESEDE